MNFVASRSWSRELKSAGETSRGSSSERNMRLSGPPSSAAAGNLANEPQDDQQRIQSIVPLPRASWWTLSRPVEQVISLRVVRESNP